MDARPSDTEAARPLANEPGRAAQLTERARTLGPGIAVSFVVALAAGFLSDHYGVPAMLMALLLGMALHFLMEGQCAAGVSFTAKTVLRIGVALLGARISVELVAALGAPLIGLVVAAVIATIGFGLAMARLLGHRATFGLLTGGSVAICGASAAMAIAAVVPRGADDRSGEAAERNLLFTVLGVTVLSTVAMVLYPVLSAALDFDDLTAGTFLGGTIHDVAQVVGAGFSVSEPAGETATLVKLVRVTMLAPVVLIASIVLRGQGDAASGVGKRAPLVPGFVIGFLVLAALNSFGALPPFATDRLSDVSRWALVTSIAAVGIKTSLRAILDVGGTAVTLIVAETAFIAMFVLVGLYWIG